ncbi:MAG: transposase, partial [Candidatus Margulisbacteria bacterium]|nr:transposase [Candidatus Margulisiibacteriota bacterium]
FTMIYKNSQKRIYIENQTYFLTTNTYKYYPFFKHDLLCELFLEELSLCQKLKGFTLFGYKINPNHAHLMIKPNKTHDFSKIMQFTKRHFARNCNLLIPSTKATLANVAFRSESDLLIKEFQKNFSKNYLQNKHTEIKNLPPFKWQKSFHYHIIEDNFDFYNHLAYIKTQWIKHKQSENKWCYIHPEYKLLIPKEIDWEI